MVSFYETSHDGTLARDQDERRRQRRVHKRIDPTWQTDQKANGYKVDDDKVTWHLYDLSSPQETSKSNTLRLTINLNQ